MNKKEISAIVGGWDYVPGQVTARWIQGSDGLPKVQLRLDLGLLQMEMEGRPDGTTPRGYASLLDYYLSLEEKSPTGNNIFQLDDEACTLLQQEAVQYYYRYLSFSALGYLDGVIRDTEHNLELFNLVARHASDDEIAWQFLQFYPHVRMMNARARTEKSVQQKNYAAAAKIVEQAIADINEFWNEYSEPEDSGGPPCEEVVMLTEVLESLRSKRPRTKADVLREDLDRAICNENYEKAAILRDALRKIDDAKR